MILAEFDYIKLDTLMEVSKYLLENRNSRIVAGGTDLFVKMRDGGVRPEKVVDIKGIEELHGMTWEEGTLSIGAAVTWTEIKENSDVQKHFPALIHAASNFGCFEIRNRATLGGNLSNAAPGCEGGCPCLIYEAVIKIFGPDGYRETPLNEFFVGPGRTSLKEGEILVSIKLPILPEGTVSAYRRASRVKGQDLATTGMAVLVVNPKDTASRKIRVALSAVARTPLRPMELEELLSHKELDPETMEQAMAWLRNNLYPRASSLRGSPDYKKIVLGTILEDILDEFDLTK